MRNLICPFLVAFSCIILTEERLINEYHLIHGATTRLCRSGCRISSIGFDQPFAIPPNCGVVDHFYACQVIIDMNYTRDTFAVNFVAYQEDEIEMYFVDYNFSIDQALYLRFYRGLTENNLIFTCLTEHHCADHYTSEVVPQLISHGSILNQLLPILFDTSLKNQTFDCWNNSDETVPCYGGYCESLTEDISEWSFHDCRYPAESSALSAMELTGLTGIFFHFEPENLENEQVNNVRLTLLCNIGMCNSPETRNRIREILDRFNQAAFNFTTSATTSISASVTTNEVSETSQTSDAALFTTDGVIQLSTILSTVTTNTVSTPSFNEANRSLLRGRTFDRNESIVENRSNLDHLSFCLGAIMVQLHCHLQFLTAFEF